MNNVYGYCPQCGGLGMSRERRLNGNDRCENGHSYPSSTAVANPLLPVAPATGHTAVAELRELRAEVKRLRVENSKLRDVLGWVEAQCPGKCAGVCFDALSGEHRREGDE